jgi:hypothetical protein
VLLKFFILLVLPVLINIFLVKVVLFGGYERCLNLFVPQVLPGEIFEPRVLLNLGRTIFTQTVKRFSLYHLKEQELVSYEKFMKDAIILTLLIKSAASSDHPFGTSFFLI